MFGVGSGVSLIALAPKGNVVPCLTVQRSQHRLQSVRVSLLEPIPRMNMQRRWYQLSLREIIGALILTAVIGGMYLQALQIKRLEQLIEQKHARQAPIYSGLANDSVLYREASGGPAHIYWRGCLKLRFSSPCYCRGPLY